jgi:hypothetical protein
MECRLFLVLDYPSLCGIRDVAAGVPWLAPKTADLFYGSAQTIPEPSAVDYGPQTAEGSQRLLRVPAARDRVKHVAES